MIASARQLQALAQRVRCVAEVLAGAPPSTAPVTSRGLAGPSPFARADARAARSELAIALAGAALRQETRALLAHLAFTGRYGTSEEIDALASRIDRAGLERAIEELSGDPSAREALSAREIVHLRPVSGLVMDVSHTVVTPGQSGIRRVVRGLDAAFTAEGAPCERIAWIPGAQRLVLAPAQDWVTSITATSAARNTSGTSSRAMAALRGVLQEALGAAVRRWAQERGGVRGPLATLLDHAARALERLRADAFLRAGLPSARRDARLEVPLLWNASILLPEIVPYAPHVAAFEAIRRALPVTLSAIGYDLLPLTHAAHFEPAQALAFVHHLRLLGSLDRVSCISRHVEGEVRKLLDLRFAGRETPPIAATHLLPSPAPATSAGPSGERAPGRPASPPAGPPADPPAAAPPPLVIAVGTIEPRKNGVAVVRAAGRIARAGLRFRLVFLGGAGWLAGPFQRALAEEKAAGLDVDLVTGADDDALARHYAACRFSVFCSLAEGYGLPIVESLAHGRPVLTSALGSMAEIAEGGGCLLVDPRDVEAIALGMRRLLTDDALLARLSAEARARPLRTWADYAREVRAFVTAPPSPDKGSDRTAGGRQGS